MKVILTEEIRGLGTRGDVVTVKDGYGRNYLIPKNLAQEATKGNLNAIEHQRRKWALLAQEEKNVAQKAADRVKGVKITVEKRVGEHGHLFGSVTANEIADALAEKGIEVDKRRIELAQPIKNIGVHDVEVRLHHDVTASIQVEVVPMGVEKLEEAPAAEETAAE
ncbi:MAG TPA: 50S ribosomal protein L9 [Thermoanaerobaculia bacterium]|jgi:large subunit ribosomal protein L9|nr:50S ribosomal protein L9 [Thermoanaerobaculia bacterium]